MPESEPATSKGTEGNAEAPSNAKPESSGLKINESLDVQDARAAQNALEHDVYTNPLGATKISPRVLSDPRKFTEYIFKEGAEHGKDKVFRGLGYGKEQSQQLTELWQKQAAEKLAEGKYTLGKADKYGQRIDIEIELPGIGDSPGKTSYLRSGWMLQPDGSIKLNTPFSGFTRGNQ